MTERSANSAPTARAQPRRYGGGAAALTLVFAAGALWLKPMGLLLWARIRILTNIPRTAIADPDSLAHDDVQERSRSSDGSGSSNGVENVRWPLVVPAEPRDPFRANPHAPHRPHVPTATDAGEGKSAGAPAEESSAGVSEDLAALARGHRLQALISGLPIAVIDGRTYRVGEVIASHDGSLPFRLVEVQDDAVILECAEGHEGRRVELRMRTDP